MAILSKACNPCKIYRTANNKFYKFICFISTDPFPFHSTVPWISRSAVDHCLIDREVISKKALYNPVKSWKVQISFHFLWIVGSIYLTESKCISHGQSFCKEKCTSFKPIFREISLSKIRNWMKHYYSRDAE